MTLAVAYIYSTSFSASPLPWWLVLSVLAGSFLLTASIFGLILWLLLRKRT